jgi:hypothetical protein
VYRCVVYHCAVLGGNCTVLENKKYAFLLFPSFVDGHNFDADPDPIYYFDADQDPDPPTTQLSQVNK